MNRALHELSERDLEDLARSGVEPVTAKPVRSGRVTTDAAARLPRQSIEQTRADMLEAAVSIVNEYIDDGPRDADPPVDPIGFLRLEEVLEVASERARHRLEADGRITQTERIAPLTAGAFYKAFSVGHHDAGRGGAMIAFRRLVVRRMIEDPLLTKADVYIGLGEQMAKQGLPWSEVARLGVLAEYRRWVETPALILMNSMALHASEREIAEWTRAVDRRQQHELKRMYGRLFEVYELHMRPGRTVEQMATAVSDLVAGMALNARFDRGRRDTMIEVDVDGTGVRSWHLCALAAWSIYDSFTEPD